MCTVAFKGFGSVTWIKLIKSDIRDIYNVKKNFPQISILEWFQKDQVTEDRSNDSENSALHHRNKLHFTIYYIVILFPNITVLLYFLSNKCSLAKYIRDFFQKH